MRFALPTAIAMLLAQAASAAQNDLMPPAANHVNRSVQDVTAFDVAMTPGQVDVFYRRELAKRGWRIGDTVSYGTTLVLDVRKMPKGAGRITIAPEGPGRTHVTVSLREERSARDLSRDGHLWNDAVE